MSEQREERSKVEEAAGAARASGEAGLGADPDPAGDQTAVQPPGEGWEQEAGLSKGTGTEQELGALREELAQARLRYEQAEATRQQVWDRYLRLQADFDNFRKRTERERSEWQERAEEELVRQILPVLDNLERALASVPAAEGSEGALGGLATGVKMVYDQLRTILEKLGLQPVEAVGRAFDPRLHEAVDRVAAPGHEPDSVVEELQRGYLFRSKLIRPSMVRVAQVPEGEGGNDIG